MAAENSTRYGLIAGNGQFPFLVLEAARSRGIEMVVAAIREEASPELERLPARVAVMRECGATALSLEAGKTLLFDGEKLLAQADAAGIAIIGVSADA